MSATEELRRMLDERGVEYDVRDGKAIKNTYWDDAEGRRWGYTSDESGEIKDRQLFLVRGRMDITPEQAIAATLNALGSWECEMEILDTFEECSGDEQYLCLCSECGSQRWEPAHDLPLYCRNCGRTVKR